MFTERERVVFLEAAKQGARWFYLNQNTDQNPWGGMGGSADRGRFIYEYFPARKRGRAAGIWAQALGIMALDAVNLAGEWIEGDTERRAAAVLAGEYMLLLQHRDKSCARNYGGFSESVPGLNHSFPRDAITGAMGMCALYRMTGEERYLESARIFADWYHNSAKDETGWPYVDYDFKLAKGFFNKSEIYKDFQGHNRFVKGDWQIGGAMFFYQLAEQTGERKYVDEYMLPMMEQLLDIYARHPVTDLPSGHRFHGFNPVSFGNDDFALISMLCAYCATADRRFYDVARARIVGLLEVMDDCGSFPEYGGTFVMGITIKVLLDLEQAMGRPRDERLAGALAKVARYGTSAQAFDYNDQRVHGGFWGQSDHDVGRDRIHQRSTGYATILYAMLADESNRVPYYHCLNWGQAARALRD